MRIAQLGLLLAVSAAAACGGNTIIENAARGSGGAPSNGVSTGGGSATVGIATGGTAAGVNSCDNATSCDSDSEASLPGCEAGPADAGAFVRPAACALSETALPEPASGACLIASMLGVWLRCSTPSVLLTTDDVGIAFNADGTFNQIYADDGCTMRRAKIHRGVWHMEPTGR